MNDFVLARCQALEGAARGSALATRRFAGAAGTGRERGEYVPTTLFILNDAPYGSERTYNALRLAGSLAKREGEHVQVFLIGDAAACAKKGQKVPAGYYQIEHMLHLVAGKGGEIGVCGSCMDARGIRGDELAEGCRRSSMEELTGWTQQAERVLVF